MNNASNSADIVIVGSGLSGLTAAITAAEGGAKAVIFEKQRSMGGTSNFIQGTFAVESEYQRRKYIEYTRDEVFKNLMEYSHWRANAALVRAIVDESGPTIAWLEKQGVEFIDVTNNLPDSPQTYHVLKGEGAAAVKALADAAKSKGVEIRLGTPAIRLLKEGSKVTGVIADDNGEDIEVSAKSVIILSGGFLNNREWLKKYTGFELDVTLIPVGNVDKTGDGIRMAWEAGAAEEGIGLVEIFRVAPMHPDIPLKTHLEFLGSQPDLWVDPYGERFCDEGITFFDTSVGNVNARYKQGYTFSVFDDSIIEHYLKYGIDRGIAMENPPGSKPVNIYKEMNAMIDRGSKEIFSADSVEELAARMEVDAETFKATVEQYNKSCEKGKDELFAKKSKYLKPLKGPKYYAIKAHTVSLGTMGGIKINHRTEVIDKKGKPIPGLYAGGFDAGGMWGDSYCIKHASGAASAFAINSGRIAAKNALKYIGE